MNDADERSTMIESPRRTSSESRSRRSLATATSWEPRRAATANPGSIDSTRRSAANTPSRLAPDELRVQDRRGAAGAAHEVVVAQLRLGAVVGEDPEAGACQVARCAVGSSVRD